MSAKESEYKELFLMEARDNLEQLDKLFVDLEKNSSDTKAIKEIFRITHTLKGNAMGMGFDAIADLSHLMEDAMIAIRENKIALESELSSLLFRANDKLGQLVGALESGEKVSFLGIKTSLSLYLDKQLQKEPSDGGGPQPEESKTNKKESRVSEPEAAESQISFSDAIQVPVKKLDDLLNEVGQLIIERDSLINNSLSETNSTSNLEQLKRITSNLQYGIMSIRMVQVGFLFNKFHRVLRDAATIEGKQVDLVLKGTETEIDRNVLKIISDSLVHLVRNSVSHGIETADIRKKQSKPETGKVTLSANHERDRVTISVSDDGGGIDHEVIRKKIVEKKLLNEDQAKGLDKDEVLQYIFESGFSNASTVNEISGRGVGMDVVKRTIESISGQVNIDTTIGKGTSISLSVPASLALKGTLIFMIRDQEYTIPLSYTEAVVSIKKSEIHKVGQGLTMEYDETPIALVILSDIFQLGSLDKAVEKGVLQKSFNEIPEDALCNVLIVSYGGRLMGVMVDKVLHQKEIIEKPLPLPLAGNELISGAAILGNGRVSPVLDVSKLTSLIYRSNMQTTSAS